MDFAALPPEVNSARMYAGPGAAPMMAAASAWSALGAELSTTASSYESVIATLTGEEWLGPASVAMATAAAPYVVWMNTTARAAEHAAAQAMASAAAYEAAFALTVPPPVIAANRAQLAALVASNILGQNTPAIAATEALYGEMWSQDAAAMYGYAGSSARAGLLDPLSSPTSTTNPAGLTGQASAGGTQSGLSQLVSGLPNAMQTMASPLAAVSTQADPGGLLSNFIGSTQNIGLFNAIQTYSTYGVTAGMWNLFAGVASAIAINSPGVEAAAAAGGPFLANAAAPVASASAAAAPTPVLAGMAQAAPVGGLSVPASWSAATPASATAATLTGTGWTAATEESASMGAVPAGMPAMASAGRGGFGFGAPRYGVKPTVMPRVVVG